MKIMALTELDQLFVELDRRGITINQLATMIENLVKHGPKVDNFCLQYHDGQCYGRCIERERR